MNKATRYASLLLAGFLHLAPLATRFLQTAPALANSPFAIVMTWLVRAAVVTGACHAVSAATAKLASAATVAGTNGVRVSYQIRINDGQNRTPQSWRILGTLFSASGSTTRGMPPGLALALGTGIISGTPTNSGSFPTAITAYENAGGGGAALTFTVTFNLASTNVATVITNHPIAKNLHIGEALTLTAGASGTPPFTYQWRKDTVNIPSATAATYSVASANSTNVGSYTVVITGAGGSATSNPAAVTVTPLSIQLLSHTPTASTFTLQTIPSRHYILERTTALISSLAWVNAGEFNATGASSAITDATASGDVAIWRYRPSP